MAQPEHSLDRALRSLRVARQMLTEGEVSSLELVERALDRAERSALNAFISLDANDVRQQAIAQDQRRRSGQPLGILAGIPVAIKDNIVRPGAPTTCGSRMLEHWHPPYEATVCRRLRQAGAVLFGKTNLDEFGMGSSGERSAFGPTQNPWDARRTPGGSSSGSAAAVAAGICPAALGSDTGGSVRQPAAFCGLSGLRPSYGRVSRHGLVAFASSLDQIGPLAHDAEDLRLLFSVIAGRDALDATSRDPRPQPARQRLGDAARPLAGLKIGRLPNEMEQIRCSALAQTLEHRFAELEALGAEILPLELPHARFSLSAYYLICMAEASSNLARYDGLRFGRRAPGEHALEQLVAQSRSQGFGQEVKRRILLGTFALSAGYHDALYGKATRARRLLRNDYARLFERVDLIAGPTTPHGAFELGQQDDDPLAMYLEDRFTVGPSLCGLPALSLPCGLTREGLPLGLQLVAPLDRDEALLSIAAAIQAESEWLPRTNAEGRP